MRQHTYLRAYMAGIVVPTLVLLAGAAAFTIWRYVYNVPVPIERIIVFPMAVVPNLWGVWNMLYIASHSRTHLPIAIHGALLPFILGPLGMLLTRTLDVHVPHFAAHIFPIFGVVALIGYYLVWKYIVGFLNALLGIA